MSVLKYIWLILWSFILYSLPLCSSEKLEDAIPMKILEKVSTISVQVESSPIASNMKHMAYARDNVAVYLSTAELIAPPFSVQ